MVIKNESPENLQPGGDPVSHARHATRGADPRACRAPHRLRRMGTRRPLSELRSPTTGSVPTGKTGSPPGPYLVPGDRCPAGGTRPGSANRASRRSPNRDRKRLAGPPCDCPSGAVHAEILGVGGTQLERTGQVFCHYRSGRPTLAVVDSTNHWRLEGHVSASRTDDPGADSCPAAHRLIRSGVGPLPCPSFRVASL